MTYWNECNEKTDTQWHWHLEGESLFIEFEGTNSTLDWKQNFDFLKKPYKRMPRIWFAHRGFINKYKSIRDRLWEVLTETLPDFVFITGYSQGGALATLAHEDIQFNQPKLCPVTFTFGAPRVVGWFAPRDRWEGLTRFRYGWDIVPLVPPWWLTYRHVGDRVHIGRRWIWPLFSIKDHLKYQVHTKEASKDG